MIEIPGYTILRPLGRGGMATVYLARQDSLGREVALKVLTTSAKDDPTAHQRFLREARIAASLHHPHIVPIHDFGLLGDLAYIAMEYEPRGTVAPMVGEKLAPRDALKIVRDIAGALDYAHGRGVVHRDIKPDNILRRHDGAALLSDFGIARLLQGASPLTAEGTSVGTPQYMSPEQLRGDKVDGRSDLYSLGVVLWQLLTGELPYGGNDAWAIGTQHITAEIPRLPAALAHLQPLLDALLAKKPEARIQTGAELAQRAAALLDITVTPETAPGPLHSTPLAGAAFVRKDAQPTRRRAVLGAGLVVLALLGWIAWRTVAPTAGPQQTIAGAAIPPASSSPASAAAPASTASIAVLALEDLSPGHDQGYFSDGMAEELQSRLAQVPGLDVAGRGSSQSFKGKHASAIEVGKVLGVGHVLDGSVRKDGARLRITMRLTNARTGFETWTQTYDRKLDDVFAVQDDIAGAVVTALKLSLLEHGPRTGIRRHTPRFDVYDMYLRGRQLMASSGTGSVAQSLAMFQGAVDRDPAFAEAWSALAMAQSFTGEGLAPAEEASYNARALVSAERAIALDPGLGDAYGTRGYLHARAWDWQRALADTRKAVALDPRDGRNQLRLGLVLATTGRLPEARAMLEAGTRADPLLLPLWYMLWQVQAAQGDIAGAQATVDHLASIEPQKRSVDWSRGVLALLEGDATTARSRFASAGDHDDSLMAAFSAAGTEAERAAVRRQRASENAVDPYNGAVADAWLGNADAAIAGLDALVSAHAMSAQMMPFDARLKALHGDPRYAALLARMGLPPATR